MRLDLATFAATNFEGRIGLINQAFGTRLWSPQLARLWEEALQRLSVVQGLDNAAARRLMREIIALAPDSLGALKQFRAWIGDDVRSSGPPPPVVYMIVSCEKYKQKAIACYEAILGQLGPLHILLGGGRGAEAVFDGPFITLPIADNYESLPLKVLEGLVAIRQKFGKVGVLKIDDDAVMSAAPDPLKIAKLAANSQYAGLVVGNDDFDRCWHVGKCEYLKDEPYRRRYRGKFCAGPLYFLGSQAVEALVREYLFFPGELAGEIFEDKAIADILRAQGIPAEDADVAGIFGISGPFEGTLGDRAPLLSTLEWETHNLSKGAENFASDDTGDALPPAAERAVKRQQYWEALFAQEDPWQYGSAYELKKFQQTLSLLPPGRISNALELGCAEGHFTGQLAPHVGHLLATDISPIALSRAAARCRTISNIEYKVLDFISDELPLGVDLVVCSEVLYYAAREDLPRLAEKFATALKPGGYLLMAHPIMIADERDRTGFDWGHEFGVRSISDAFSASGRFVLLQELRSELYRIQLYQIARGPADLRGSPSVIDTEYAKPLPPNVERTVIWGGAVLTRAEARAQLRAKDIPILMYHSIADDGAAELAPYRVRPGAFQEQMRFLRRHGYHSISLEEWARCLEGGIELPGRPVVITFDDGYKNFLTTAAPLLEAADFRATLFVVTEKVGRTADWEVTSEAPLPLMDWNDLQSLQSRGFVIGSHTTLHSNLLNLSDEEIVRDSEAARSTIRAHLGRDAQSVVFPWGLSDSRVRAALARGGYQIGLATTGGRSSLFDDPMNLPRIEIFGDDDLETFERRLTEMGDGVTHRRSGTGALLASIESVVEPMRRTSGKKKEQTAMTTAYAHMMAHKVGKLIESLLEFQADLLTSTAQPQGIQERLTALFSMPIMANTAVAPFTPLVPGASLGFAQTATVKLCVRAKTSHAVSPESCLNTVELSYTGSSSYLSLEVICSWNEIVSAERFQLGFAAEPDHAVQCQAMIRLPQKNGEPLDHFLTAFKLEPDRPVDVRWGTLKLPELDAADSAKPPVVLFFFDPKQDLKIQLNYISLYFA